MEKCSKCSALNTLINEEYKYHNTYNCLSCGNWWYCRIDTCCRKPYLIVTQCHKFSPHTRLYRQCTNCGGCLNRTKPLKFKDYDDEIEGLFYDEYFEDWKKEYNEEAAYIYKNQCFANYLNSHYYKYKSYLLSSEWKNKRDEVMKRDKSLCQHCKVAPADDVHHLTYDNLFDEPLDDLLSLCRSCHANEHKSDLS